MKIDPSENSPMVKKYFSPDATKDESGGQDDQVWQSDPRDHSQVEEFFANQTTPLMRSLRRLLNPFMLLNPQEKSTS